MLIAHVFLFLGKFFYEIRIRTLLYKINKTKDHCKPK